VHALRTLASLHDILSQQEIITRLLQGPLHLCLHAYGQHTLLCVLTLQTEGSTCAFIAMELIQNVGINLIYAVGELPSYVC
jgi:hypothetical protein